MSGIKKTHPCHCCGGTGKVHTYDHDEEVLRKAGMFAESIRDSTLSYDLPCTRTVTLRSSAMWRGSWRIGYKYSRNVRVRLTWNRTDREVRVADYVGPPDVARFAAWWKRSKARMRYRVDHSYSCAHEMYRLSGLIPKRVAKRHSAELRATHGERWSDTLDGCQDAMRIGGTWIAKRARCPQCSARGHMKEDFVGWTCAECDAHVEPKRGV